MALALLAAPAVAASTRASFARASTGPHRCVVPNFGKPLGKLWRPDMKAAIRYAHSRRGDIAFAVRTQNDHWGYRTNHQEWSASIVKAMLLVAYISEPSVAHRKLTAREKSILSPMITQSNNDDAQLIYNQVGNSGLEALAHRVGMTHFATNPERIWGETLVTPHDQTKYFLHIDSYMPSSHRLYAMGLLNSITPSQRWGIGKIDHQGWRLYFKGGWGYATGLIDSQVALLTRGCARVSLAVLTMNDGSHPYGKETLRQLFSRLLRGFPRAK